MALMNWKVAALYMALCTTYLRVPLARASNCKIQTNSGKEFYLGIPYLDSTDVQPDFFIYASSNYVGHVDISFEKINTTHRYALHGTLEIPVPKEYNNPRSNRKEHNGIFLLADVDVSVYVVSKPVIDHINSDCGQGMDGYMALPQQLLSTKHVIASYEPHYSNDVEVIVIATQDSTTVSFIKCKPACNSHSVTLDRLDSYLFNDSSDLTSVMATSDKPVAVISATNLASVYAAHMAYPPAESLFEWIYPTEFAAHEFVVPNLPERNGCIIKVLLTEEDTTVTFHNKTTVTTEVLYKYNNKSFVFMADPLYVHADKPIFIYQYGMTEDGSGYYGAFMRNIPAIEYYVNSASFVLQSDVDMIDNYIQVLIPHGSIVSYDRVNIILATTGFADHVNVNGSVYSITTISSAFDSNLTSHFLTSSADDQLFGVLVTGYGKGGAVQCAYGYPIAVKTKVCNADTSTTSPVSSTPAPSTSSITPDIGPLCLECNDLSQLYLCEIFTRCQSDQICYVERYQNAATQVRYRSGCIQKSLCSPGQSLCRECCHGNFCNINGCGAASLPPLGVDRGPLCLSCLHTTDVDSCQTLSYCDRDEVCMIEISSLFGSLQHYNMGCARQDCFSMDHRRSTTLCKSCCKEDFCNNQCRNTSSPAVPIIG